jgi:hypothetical protein
MLTQDGEYTIQKNEDGQFVLVLTETARMSIDDNMPKRLSFFNKIRDQFLDPSSFAQDENFNNAVTMEVQSIAVQCGVLDVQNKRHMTAFKNFCPSGLHFYRSLSVEKTISALCFLNLLWFVDDLLDDGHLSEEESTILVDCVCDVFTIDYDPEKSTRWSNIVGYALTVRERLLKHMDHEWLEQFGRSYRVYAKASLEETKKSRSHQEMTVEEYATLRMFTSAVFPCQELLAMLYDFKFEPSAELDRARVLTNRIISFTNDIFSFEKEFNSNSLNLLKVYMNIEKCSLNVAVDKAVDLINADIDELLRIEEKVSRNAEWLEKCITGLKIMIQGNALWSRRTKRYCTPTSPFEDLREQYEILCREV